MLIESQIRQDRKRFGRAVIVWTLVLVAASALLVANKYLPYTIRFSYTPLNNLVAILLLLAIPVGLVGFGLSLNNRWGRWCALVLGAITTLPAGLMSLFIGLDAMNNIANGKDVSLERIAELRDGGATYRAYRTNGGAMTDFGLVVRREYDLLPGIRAVSVILSQYHASEATLGITPAGKLKVVVAAYGENHPGFTEEFPH